MRSGPASLGAVLAACGAIVLAPAGGSAQTSGRTLTLFQDDRGGTYRFIDNPPHSPVAKPESPKARFSAGDEGYWTSPIRDGKDGRRVGTAYGTDTVRTGTRYPHVINTVHVVFALDDGQILVEQAIDESKPGVPAAVIGGTGTYAGARGTLAVKPARGGNRLTFTLLP
jgi:hypothetical protein